MPPLVRLLDERCERLALVTPALPRHAVRCFRPGLFGWAMAEAECGRNRTIVLGCGLAFPQEMARARGDVLRARGPFFDWTQRELAVTVRLATRQ